MLYKSFQGWKLSALGMGAMRLPVIDGDDSRIDETAAEQMVAYAMESGINYYDTAWGYHNGQSELIMGRLLRKYPRESYFLASKFPGYDLANMDKVEEIFEKQLEKCGVDYFDFYLFHNVCEMNIDAYLNPKYGIFAYLMKQKQAGRIRHLGFSAHGSYGVMKRFLHAYGADMEFGQIQLNYLDWKFQDAQAKVELLREFGIPVWVMEPLRGGRLVTLSKEDTEKLHNLRPEEPVPAWAFRFLQSIPSVTMVLSGMSNLEQMQENIRTFEEEKPLNPQEMKALLCIADTMVRKNILPVQPATIVSAIVRRAWTFHPCLLCITNTTSQRVALLHPWHYLQLHRINGPAPVSHAGAVRPSVPNRLKYRRQWPVLRRNWDKGNLMGVYTKRRPKRNRYTDKSEEDRMRAVMRRKSYGISQVATWWRENQHHWAGKQFVGTSWRSGN